MTKAPLGGEKTGPNPTDRAKKGAKRSLLTEAKGIPIGLVTDGANRNDMKLVESTLESMPIERPEPSPEKPQHMCMDKGYDYADVRQTVDEWGYTAHMEMSGGLIINGPTGLQQYFEMLSTAYPDHHATIDELFASENKAAMRTTLSGTHNGPLRDIPPTGNKIKMPYMAIGHIDNGKLTKLYVDLDRLEYMMQLGVIDRPA